MEKRFCFEVLLLILSFTIVTSSYSDFDPSSNFHSNTALEYGKPQNDFEYNSNLMLTAPFKALGQSLSFEATKSDIMYLLYLLRSVINEVYWDSIFLN